MQFVFDSNRSEHVRADRTYNLNILTVRGIEEFTTSSRVSSMDLFKIFTDAGPFVVAGVMAYMWRLERAERLEAQKESKKLREHAEATAWKTAERLFEQAAATRDHQRAHDSNIELLLSKANS